MFSLTIVVNDLIDIVIILIYIKKSREKKNPLGKPKDYIRVILLLGILMSLSTLQVVEYFVNEVYSLFRKISLIFSSSSKNRSLFSLLGMIDILKPKPARLKVFDNEVQVMILSFSLLSTVSSTV